MAVAWRSRDGWNKGPEWVPLENLLGEHTLSGVDRSQESIKAWWDEKKTETVDVLRFVLDGKTYTAMEDPEDGYRSCMKSLLQTADVVSNTFLPQSVLGSYRQRNEKYGENDDVVEFSDMITGQIVLEIGTEGFDDYYPCFVANFYPEHMACNQDKKG